VTIENKIDNRNGPRPRRLNLLLVGMFSIFLIGAMTVFTFHAIQEESKRITISMKAQAQVLANNLAATSADQLLARDYTAIERMLLRSAEFPGIFELQISDSTGKIIGDVLNQADEQPQARYGQAPLQIPEQNKTSIKVDNEQLLIWQPVVLGELIGWVRIIYSLDEITKVKKQFWLINAATGIVVILFASGLLFYFLRIPISAIERYTDFADHLDEHQGERVSVSSCSLEMQKLGSALNRASARLQEQSGAINDAMQDLERLAAFPEYDPNFIVSMNAEGKVDYLNPHTLKTLSDLELSNNEVSRLLPLNMDVTRKQCLKHGLVIRGVEVFFQGHTYLWTFAPLVSQGLLHCYGVEITESKIAQKAARVAQIERHSAMEASRAKSTFLANMSHEIRTPLTAIIGFSESLLDTEQSMTDRVKSIKTIIRSGKHLLHLINEILDLSKIEADKLDVEQIRVSLFDITHDVYSLVELQTMEKGLQFSIDYNFPLPETIISDPLRLKQILINLCSNAVKFTDKGSVRVMVSFDARKHYLRFDVEDTGTGMTSEQLEKLFNAFVQADADTTRRYGGTGLGLHLSKQLSQKLGGTITATSTPGGGSCFSVTVSTGDLGDVRFVTKAPEESIRTDKPIISPKQMFTGKVLLAEDNVDNQRLISMYLSKIGVDVVIAENGIEAVDKALHQVFDLVLMDMQMPLMDGLQATREIREKNSVLPILALTANTMQEDIIKCRDAGCSEFISKPIDIENFYRVLAQYLKDGDGKDLDTSPLISELLEQDASFAELVEHFIDKLPGLLGKLRQALRESDWESVETQVHDLKSTGGGYGFPRIAKVASNMEFNLAKNEYDALANYLLELDMLCDRIVKGVHLSPSKVT
jgi:signal transduction histidine kinase/ActR/RegA family two-component response regulator